MKPQAIAARAFVMGLHAHRAGTITRAELDALGAALDASIAEHGKP